MALAFAAGSTTLVAVTRTLVLAVTEGAVNRPVLEIVPAAADQVTAVLFVPVRVAVNWYVAAATIVALEGEMATPIVEAGITFTAAVAFAVGSATLVAVM